MSADAAMQDVAAAIAAVELAKATRNSPGGVCNLQAAEVRCGRLIAEHGATLLKALAENERVRLRAGYVQANR